jgi:hypothetical protein
MNKRSVIDMKPNESMKLQKRTMSMCELKKKFQKAPKVSKHISTMNLRHSNLQLFQRDLPKFILRQDHNFTKKLKIIK